ncbi:hypothetical protein XENTR_v10017945 [Xenopus tropicalis]|uniref:Synaptonemal complex central element protein 3 n=1 Tax=Xenopus tropicalis TaxID=8364 RepID=A0A6I8RQN2_XENTR|nr:synaptonemal complex central element protein 3 [Xenopus tropicalis]KAE8590098.1 hypothetical protein XENTR_v10017945 [Xenopus tropicalis]KAE8590099.1 hypothetical protein XENTR_v10017945 [Xenopus tropicalis]
MAEPETSVQSLEDVSRMLRDLNDDLENMLEKMETLSVRTTEMAYDMVVLRTNPALAQSMKRLEDAFFKCREEIEKNWQEMLEETKQKTKPEPEANTD